MTSVAVDLTNSGVAARYLRTIVPGEIDFSATPLRMIMQAIESCDADKSTKDGMRFLVMSEADYRKLEAGLIDD